MSVLGPEGRGVVVATEDPAAASADVQTLAGAGIRSATVGQLGLSLPEPPPDLTDLVSTWSIVARRPAIARRGDRLASSAADGTASVHEPAAISSELLGGGAPRRVAVFGGAWASEDDEAYVGARALGARLAGDGVQLISGGYGGVMEAASRGASEAGGVAIGVSIAPWADRVRPNPHLTHHAEAASLLARFPLLLDADAWVAFPGGVGTLAEVGQCWNLMQMSIDPRPLLLVGDGWARALEALREVLVVRDPAELDLIRTATVEEAATIAAGEGT